ncbi:permease for cytosine/purines, uracil, thiamine, allantoin-domain-containing protein [Mucidula mucida]|nr:permease for cytosine/purines, uracil, thiamine, allantoin-domain-containing protein [Mucidula mucida]
MSTTYWSKVKRVVQVPQDRFVSEGHQWSNHDLDPTPPEERKWAAWVFAAFWMAHAMNASAWTAGSATVALGLKWWQAWLALNVAHIIGTFMVVANGRMAARYHIGFPVCARSSWGMWGSYMAVTMRAIVCIIWNGVNTFYAGRLVDVCLQCIWPSWADVENILPESAGVTTRQLAGFFIAWFIFQCLTVVHPRDLKYFYMVKSVIVFAAMNGVLIWWMKKNGGASFPSQANSKLSSTERGWLFMQAFNSGFGTLSSLTVNQADIARYARLPQDQFYGQVFVFPIASALPGLYGILVASASEELYGTAAWNLWDVCQTMLDQYPHNRGARFAIFMATASMALALIAVNLATNCLPFGSDVTAMFPKYMTIRRGQFICCLLGMAIVPWKILKDGTTFLAFLSGYGYWLAPGAAILLVDYFFVQRGNLIIKDLYTGSHNGRYWYTKGWNVRAPVVTVLALIPCMPGFAASIAPNGVHISAAAKHMNTFSFLLTYIIAAFMYFASYVVWPIKGDMKIDEPFEALADLQDQEEKRALAGSDDSSLSSDGKRKEELYDLS